MFSLFKVSLFPIKFRLKKTVSVSIYSISFPSRVFSSLRQFSSLKSWNELPVIERDSWIALGWSESHWKQDFGVTSPSTLKSFGHLTSEQQAIVLHGLRMNENAWNQRVSSWKAASSQTQMSTTSSQSSKSITSRPSSSAATSKIISLASQAAVVVGGMLKRSSDKNLSMLGSFLETAASLGETLQPPTVVNELETVVYLDDSYSMESQNLSAGHGIFRAMLPLIRGEATRVLKFAFSAVLVHERGTTLSATKILPMWDGRGGGTYLWHMVLQDVKSRYRPGKGKLRLVVITDGDDVLSPSEFQGVRGMDPLMKQLTAAGFDVEWHIIIIGGEVTDINRYSSLASATGGSFLVLNYFDEKNPAVVAFLKRMKNSASDERADYLRRLRERREYELDAATGKATKFDWLKELPPPKSK